MPRWVGRYWLAALGIALILGFLDLIGVIEIGVPE